MASLTKRSLAWEWISQPGLEYFNLSSGYTAVLDVDRDGLVVNYPGVWRQIEI
jgi:hypothetical protein